jgi:UDP-N-acetylmuramoyl-tripeptide--D-alanyl-D-alanine ligase
MSGKVKNKISYGTKDATYVGVVKEDSHFLEVEITKGLNLKSIKTQLAGNYNLPNVLSAVCIGKTFDVADEKIIEAIENYIPSNSRSQIMQSDSNTILLDAYNANPSSMKAAIENFAAMAGTKKIVILGAMMELGKDSIAEHKAIVDLLLKYNWDKIVLTGKDYQNLPENILHFNTPMETKAWYKAQNIIDTHILIKGSRGMAMENILE